MKLTAKQILQIEETLVLNGINYDDIKLELTDHIASEIEEKINVQGVSFEGAFHEVFENWKEQLRPTTSFWVGRNNSTPKIVLDKWVRIKKQILLKAFLIAFLPTLLVAYFFYVKQHNVDYTLLMQMFKTLCLSLSAVIIIFKFLIFKSKLKTSFSLYFSKNLKVLFIYLFFIGLGAYPSKFNVWNYGTSLFFILMLSFLVLYAILCLQLAYQHLKFFKKIQLS
jgi:hypothetical protein